jgi:hypothetical protein
VQEFPRESVEFGGVLVNVEANAAVEGLAAGLGPGVAQTAVGEEGLE